LHHAVNRWFNVACHGGQKILGFPPGGHGMPKETLGIIGAWIELVGGFMIAFGLLTRVAAFISSGEMAVGYFMAHAPGGFSRSGITANQLCFIAGSFSSSCFMALAGGASTR
jgi:putative oxidoreductase